MQGDKYSKAREEASDCVTSFHRAMQDAGGSLMNTEVMKTTSIMDFITTVAAQNNIRFKYEKPKEENVKVVNVDKNPEQIQSEILKIHNDSKRPLYVVRTETQFYVCNSEFELDALLSGFDRIKVDIFNFSKTIDLKYHHPNSCSCDDCKYPGC